MNTIRIMNNIWDYLHQYKRAVDGYCNEAREMQRSLDAKVNELKNSGNYTEQYINSYKARNAPALKYTDALKKERLYYAKKVTPFLEDLEEELNSFFEGEVSQSFSAKITAAQAAGLRFEDEDFDLLEKQASTYLECKIIDTLANNRKKTTERYSHKKGEIEKIQIADPYEFKKNLPSPTEAKARYFHFKNTVTYMLEHYCGTDAVLVDCLENVDKSFGNMAMIVNADAAIRTDHVFSEYSSLVKSIRETAPAWAKNIPTITKTERESLDSALDPLKAEKRTREEMQQFAKDNPYLGGLAAKDSRYMKHFEPEPKYIM